MLLLHFQLRENNYSELSSATILYANIIYAYYAAYYENRTVFICEHCVKNCKEWRTMLMKINKEIELVSHIQILFKSRSYYVVIK
jgi:hypothetical protein